jgi:hypothetical protein
MKQLKNIILILFVSAPFLSLLAQESEYEVKAHFLGRFAYFIEWPQTSAVQDSAKPFIIGVYGKDPFNGVLDKIYAGQTIKGKVVIILYLDGVEEINKCDMLFISSVNNENLKKFLEYTADKPIVTIADTPGYAEAGALINLFKEKDKIRFEINFNAVKSAGLVFNYKLLDLARIVGKESN